MTVRHLTINIHFSIYVKANIPTGEELLDGYFVTRFLTGKLVAGEPNYS